MPGPSRQRPRASRTAAFDMDVRGVELLRAVGAQMKTADRSLRLEYRGALRKGTRPAIKAARARARSTMPKRGGYAARLSRTRITTLIRDRGRTYIGLRIVAKRASRRVDEGVLRHPVFGHRDRWVEQKVPAGWFSASMRQNAPRMREELLRSLHRYQGRVRAAAMTGRTTE